MKKKLFMYSTSLLLLIILIALIISSMIIMGLFPNYLYVFIPLTFVFLACFWYLFAVGVFSPITISSEGIKNRGKFLSWDKIKITLCPIMTRSWQYGYYLIVSDEYIVGNKIKKEMKRRPCIYLRKSVLKIILPFYKTKVKILDINNSICEEMKSSKSINDMIKTHNSQFIA